ncbi:MAG: radical SAM protein [Elusimicrobia bacterium]|nr:radical SAM protein [Elusimicrobiota bacterium]
MPKRIRTVLLNPPPIGDVRFIREGRCMQSIDSWAAIWPPLTLAILASIARKYGEVDLFDCNVEDDSGLESVLARVRRFAPDLVVVNNSFPSIEADSACAAAIRRACPNAPVVGYGVFFTLLEGQALETATGYDLGIVGEPEVTFEELISRLAEGKPLYPMAGLAWRTEGRVESGPPRGLIADLDHVPVAARELLRNDRYVLPHNGRPFTLINVARGCPYPCTFCIAPVYYGKKLRKHSIDYVLAELERCQKELGLRDFLFWEEVFSLDREYGVALCEALLRKGWDISWATTTRADKVDEELLRLMKRAGCMLLGLGIETASQEILDGARKGVRVEQVRAAVAMCRRVGLKTMGHFIFGLPGETPRTVERTIDYAIELGLDYVQCYCAVPYPKTPLGEQAREQGWIRSARWADFDFGGFSIMDVGSIAPAGVDHARKEMFRRFYLRPSFLARQVAMLLARPRQLLQASRFLRWMGQARWGSGSAPADARARRGADPAPAEWKV